MSTQEDRERQIRELQEAIHKIHLHKLVNLDNYMSELERLSKGEEEARGKLEVASTIVDIKRWGEVGKSYVNQKNIIREIRYAIKLSEDEEQRLRDIIAAMKAGIKL